MNSLLIILGFMFGTIIGSFLGVVVWRMGTGRGIGGRSMCLSCNRTLAWYELVPVVSFLLQRGKCRKCKSEIPIQDFWIEIATGALFALTAVAAEPSLPMAPLAGLLLLLEFVWVGMGVVVAAYDLRHKIIHLPALVAFFITGILVMVAGKIFTGSSLGVMVWVIALRDAALVASPFFLIWLISRGKWIGFGDIEIMAIAGFLLGLGGGYSAVFLGFWIACVIVVPVYAYYRARRNPLHPEIPFGPFLLLGIWLVALCHANVFAFMAGVLQ